MASSKKNGSKSSAKSSVSPVSTEETSNPTTADETTGTVDTSTGTPDTGLPDTGPKNAAPAAPTFPRCDRAAVVAAVLAACEGKIGAVVDRLLAMNGGDRVTRETLHAMIGAPRTVQKDGKEETTIDRFDVVKATVAAVQANAPGMLVDLTIGRNAGLYLGFVPEVSEEEKKAKASAAKENAKALIAKGKAADSLLAEKAKMEEEIAALRALLAKTNAAE